MNKILISFLLLICFFTTLICVKKPKMHNKILVYSSDYVIVEEKKPEIKTKKIEKELPTIKQEVKKQNKQEIIKKSTPKTEKIEEKKENKQTSSTKEIVKKEQTIQKPIQKEIRQETKKEIKILTEEEENIAWNKWHSDLQNKLMNDIKLPILPEGTVFKFSFTVDKYGKISKIQTSSTTPQYTPFAIEYIAPIIKSYQGTSILNFPDDSQRSTTTFNGGFKISQTSKFSSPNDYNDTERIKK